MININPQKMIQIVNEFEQKRILVLGDLMMDKYIWGHVSRISPEAPIPVVVAKRDTSCLGGAGNVAHNLQKLGASPLLSGIVGEDKEGDSLCHEAGKDVCLQGKISPAIGPQ